MTRLLVAAAIACGSVTLDAQPADSRLAMAVMLDVSMSMTSFSSAWDSLKKATVEFLNRSGPADQMMLGAFNDRVVLTNPLGKGDLVSMLDEVRFGDGSRLYDAIVAGADALERVDGRRVLIVGTDGEADGSKSDWRDALERLDAADVKIYAVTFRNSYFDGRTRRRTREDRNLKRLVEETGGCYVRLTGADDLGATFARLADELYDGARPHRYASTSRLMSPSSR